jgi:hypothetical protein
MCLDVISEEVERKFKNKRVGYKVFYRNGNAITGEYFGDDEIYPINKWMDEKGYRDPDFKNKKLIEKANTNDCYPFGWHIFLTRKAARGWRNYKHYVVKKVEFLDPVAWGFQSKDLQNVPVVVAKKMIITKDKV